MSDDELEIAILEKYIERYESVGEENRNKCARELDMREVLTEIKGDATDNLEHTATIWLNRLAPPGSGKARGVLRRCSDSAVSNASHKFNARAFTDVINNQPAPAWDRVRELRNRLDDTATKQETGKDVLLLSPNIYGVGINIKEGWKHMKKWLKKNFT